jgi:hypothetical protein
MPWKIVHLDYASPEPHLHLKDPSAAIHLRSYFSEPRVQILLGAEDAEECFVRALVTPENVVVEATRFQAAHVQILASIFASLDVEPGERASALAWMQERLATPRDAGEMVRGNVDAFPPPSGWPYDLSDETLLESLDDREGAPHTRIQALLREAQRRGLRPASPSPRAPEVFHRRPRH